MVNLVFDRIFLFLYLMFTVQGCPKELIFKANQG